MQKTSHSDINVPNGSRDISFQSQELEQYGCCHFCRFLALFSLKYDVTDAMLQDIESATPHESFV